MQAALECMSASTFLLFTEVLKAGLFSGGVSWPVGLNLKDRDNNLKKKDYSYGS